MPREKPLYDAINSNRRPSIAALAVTVGLIVYGSLYPFAFHTCLDPVGAFRDLFATWKQPSSLGDLLANVLLYLPLGLFAAKALPEMASPLRVITAVLAGTGLSMSVELAQMCDVGRVSAMSDVYANSFGALLGAVAATALSIDLRLRYWPNLRHHAFAPLLLFCWLAYRLFPYVPVIDVHKYWHAVRPLLVGPGPAFGDLLRHFASWLGVGALLESVWGRVAARIGLPVLVAVVLCMRIGIDEIALSRAEVIGGTCAAALWVAWLYCTKRRTSLVAAALAAAVLVEALEPFQFLTAPRPFSWIPFRAFIDGSIQFAVPSLMAKFFLYGTLVWSLARAGLRWTSATAATAVFVFVVHYLQRYLPGRSAEITDALLALIAGALMKFLDGGAKEELHGL